MENLISMFQKLFINDVVLFRESEGQRNTAY